MSSGSTTQRLQSLLDRLLGGDEAARDDLINQACERLIVLTRRMFRDFPRLRQWEQTEDVSQNAVMRLRRALESVHPGSVREFFGLAALQIRRELLDMTRSVYGRAARQDDDLAAATDLDAGDNQPPGGRKPVRVGLPAAGGTSDTVSVQVDPADATHDPDRLSAWSEFHNRVDELPDNLREVVELLWYQELSQQEAAELLGVDKSTVKRRWRQARLKLYDAVRDWLPGEQPE